MKKSALCLAIVALSACATQSVSYSSSLAAPGAREVFAESSKFNFLGLTPTPMQQLSALRDQLNDQCENRGVTGIVAKTSTIYAIIGFVEKTEVSGYCEQ
jgi:hypothetical protein